MLKHLFLVEYKRAMLKEFTSLINRGTFEYKEYINKLILFI
jgi:hypothetical protein